MNAKVIISLVGGIVCLVSGLGVVPMSTVESMEELSILDVAGVGGVIVGLPPLALVLFAGAIILLTAAMYFRANESA